MEDLYLDETDRALASLDPTPKDKIAALGVLRTTAKEMAQGGHTSLSIRLTRVANSLEAEADGA